MTVVMNVLVIRFSSLGDVIMASAVIEALRRSFPSSNIHVLTKALYQQVYTDDPRIAQLIGIRGGESAQEIVHLLGACRYDCVIDLHHSIRSIGVTSLLESPVKLHIRKHGFSRRLMILSRNRFHRRFDMLDSYLKTIRPLGFVERVLPRIYPDPEAVLAGERLLQAHRISREAKFIGIAPGSRHAMKRWDEHSFAAMADEIMQRGDVPVFLGDREDRQVIARIASLMTDGNIWSLAGELDLRGAIGLISRLDAVVSNDSGPMHIAGALGVPFVAMFGPTHPDLGFCPGYPRGAVLTTNESCSPCSLHGAAPCRMPSRRCMDGITWRMVSESLDKLT